jgi:hypothetical protein
VAPDLMTARLEEIRDLIADGIPEGAVRQDTQRINGFDLPLRFSSTGI